jgi:bifunctional non-homologous end joining protein LigD
MPTGTALPPNLAVSNVDKVLFPGSGFTKGDMLRYYWNVAEVMLPHLRQRPITMIRWPDGIGGFHFYEKQAPRHAPSWVKTAPVPRSDGDRQPINYILIKDARTLLWVANLASIEIHPFLHRFPRIDAPTLVAFDLDPGEGTTLLHCIEVARLLRGLLEHLGLEAWPKVTGSKGLQLYVPLNTPVTYAATNPFAHTVAQLLEREHPQLVVSRMTKVLRKGKILIDWSQNHEKKTTVAAYSLRGKRDVPYVSAPVTWDELDRARARSNFAGLFFTPDAMLARIRRYGDLFVPVLERKQKLPEAFLPAARRTARRATAKLKGVRTRNTSRRTTASRRS